MPGRLDFETEWENDAETAIKDLLFGKVFRFGGDSQPEKEPGKEDDESAPPPVNAVGAMPASSRGMGLGSGAGKVTQRKDEKKETNDDDGMDEDPDDDEEDAPLSQMNGINGATTDAASQQPNGTAAEEEAKRKKSPEKEDDDDEGPMGDEDDEDLELKLAILDIYNERYDRRMASKAVIFDRNLLEYRKVFLFTATCRRSTDHKASAAGTSSRKEDAEGTA